MNAAHTKKLVEDFPELFYYYKHREGTVLVPMAFGFECGDGWFELIYNLSKDIVAMDDHVQAAQVKEKFGGLRFYINGTRRPEVFDRINEAEQASYSVCELCGKPGKPYSDGWIQTLCPDCRRKKKHKEVLFHRSMKRPPTVKEGALA